MEKQTVIPQDIFDDANQIYKPYTTWNDELNCTNIHFQYSERDAYIKGRVDERAISFTEKQLIMTLNDFGEHVSEKISGNKLQMICELSTWFYNYKQQKLKNND